VSLVHDVLVEAIFAAAVLISAALFATSLGFVAGISVGRWHLALALAVVLSMALARGIAARRPLLVAAGTALTLLGCCGSLGLASRSIDTSYDGLAYHQVGVIALRDGWNPLGDGPVMTWSRGAFPERQTQADQVADGGLWVDHYPKASWILGAIVSAATGSLDMAKWSRPFALGLAAAALFIGLLACGIQPGFAGLAALAGALSPVVVSQLETNYVDGLLGCALIVQCGATMAWVSRRRRSDLFVAWAMAVLATNLKFTGLVYSGLLLVAMFAIAGTQRWRPQRADLVLVAASLVGLIVVSWQPYVTNVVQRGDLFYPINAVPIMEGQAAPEFLQRNRISKFLIASTQASNFGPALAAPEWPVPRAWHYGRLAQVPYMHRAGFGPLFVYSALGALATLVCAILAGWRGRRPYPKCAGLLLVIGWVVLSSLLNPEFWWARYAPQLWCLPVLVAALSFRMEWRTAALVNLAPPVLAAALLSLFWVQGLSQSSRAINYELPARIRNGEVAVSSVATNAPKLFSFAQVLQQRGVKLRVVPADQCNAFRLGMIELCDPPGP
jgi:hypothetical protein